MLDLVWVDLISVSMIEVLWIRRHIWNMLLLWSVDNLKSFVVRSETTKSETFYLLSHRLCFKVKVGSIQTTFWILILSEFRWWNVKITQNLCSFPLSLSLYLISWSWLLRSESKGAIWWTILTMELFLLKNESLNFIQWRRVALWKLLLLTDALLFVAEASFLVKVIESYLPSSVVCLAISNKWISTWIITVTRSTTSSWLELFIVNLEVIGGAAIDSSGAIK